MLGLFYTSLCVAQTKIIILGDSLTEGYKVAPEYSFPSQLEKKLIENGYEVKIINGGVSGSTTASGASRLKWFLKAKPSILILALGANDGLRGLKIKDTKDNLDKIIVMAKKEGMKIILAGMRMPPNYGKEYREKFKNLYYELAKNHKIAMIPFLLRDVAGKKELNIEDGIHPNKEGYKIISNTVFNILKDYL